MTKQEAAAMLVQLYADYSTLCDKYGWPPSDEMPEAVAVVAGGRVMSEYIAKMYGGNNKQ